MVHIRNNQHSNHGHDNNHHQYWMRTLADQDDDKTEQHISNNDQTNSVMIAATPPRLLHRQVVIPDATVDTSANALPFLVLNNRERVVIFRFCFKFPFVRRLMTPRAIHTTRDKFAAIFVYWNGHSQNRIELQGTSDVRDSMSAI